MNSTFQHLLQRVTVQDNGEIVYEKMTLEREKKERQFHVTILYNKKAYA